MQIAKVTAGVGLAMMAFGAVSRIVASQGSKRDPDAALMNEGGGSFMVFGAAIAALSLALHKREPQ
jgi:hypothetical protein